MDLWSPGSGLNRDGVNADADVNAKGSGSEHLNPLNTPLVAGTGQPPALTSHPFSGVGSHWCHCALWHRRCQRASWSTYRGHYRCDNAVRVSGEIDANGPSAGGRPGLWGSSTQATTPPTSAPSTPPTSANDHDHWPTTPPPRLAPSSFPVPHRFDRYHDVIVLFFGRGSFSNGGPSTVSRMMTG